MKAVTLARAPQEDSGLRRAFEEALELRRRALGGDADAQIQMSRAFQAGEGNSAAPRESWEREYAASWLRRAANQNNVDAQFALSRIFAGFYDHDGVTWLRRAAATGHLEATHHLGQRLLSAGSFYRKPVEALRWLRLAANAGYVPSQHALGDLLLHGQVPHDPVEACVWYQLGGDAGNARCRAEASRLAPTLTPEQRAEVERRVRDWRPTPLKR